MKYVATLAAVVVLVAVACVPAPPEPPPDGEPDLCQPGWFSATGEEPCDPAPAGTFVDSEGATEATDCEPGTYQDQEGQTSCEPAQPGSYVDVAGATAATLCPLGTYQPDAGQTSCLQALIGTYVGTTGATAATNCPTGETTDSTGSTSLSDCYVPGDVLAIAYSNLDGSAGFAPGGADRLISRLVDTNTDGVPSAGDTIEFGEYPLDVLASDFGTFGTSSLVATSGITPPPGSSGLAGIEAAGWFYTWNDHGILPPNVDPFPVDAYQEGSSLAGTPSGDPIVVVTDSDTDADGPDAVEVNLPGPPSNPDTAPILDFQTGGTGDAFIEVEVFPAGPI
jgi:hypothetical protein